MSKLASSDRMVRIENRAKSDHNHGYSLVLQFCVGDFNLFIHVFATDWTGQRSELESVQ